MTRCRINYNYEHRRPGTIRFMVFIVAWTTTCGVIGLGNASAQDVIRCFLAGLARTGT